MYFRYAGMDRRLSHFPYKIRIKNEKVQTSEIAAAVMKQSCKPCVVHHGVTPKLMPKPMVLRMIMMDTMVSPAISLKQSTL